VTLYFGAVSFKSNLGLKLGFTITLIRKVKVTLHFSLKLELKTNLRPNFGFIPKITSPLL